MGRRGSKVTGWLLVGALLVGTATACSSGGSSDGDAAGPTTEAAPTSTPAASGATTTSTTAPVTTTTVGQPIACTPPAAGDQEIEVDGVTRTFTVSVPTAFTGRAPVVLAFHGFASSADQFAAVTGMAEQGTAAGAIVVLPQALGSPPSWGIVVGFDDDRAFVDALLERVLASDCADGDRVWLSGFSAGSGFSGVYGCGRANDEPGSIAGLVLVSGLPPAICPEAAAPRVLVASGTADPVVRFQGGDKEVDGQQVALDSVPASTAAWAERGGCTEGPEERGFADDLTLSSWSACGDSGPVDLLAIADGGHAWPGGAEQAAAGRATQSVSLTCVTIALATAADRDVDLGPIVDACPGDHPDLTGG